LGGWSSELYPSAPHPPCSPHDAPLLPAPHTASLAPRPPPQDGGTPLHEAAFNGRTEAVKALIEGKADLEAKNEVRGAEERGVSGDKSGGGRGCWLAACRLESCSNDCGQG
jgi:hypothetical protein